MAKYDKIIFVCSDNTCRSPVAAAILKKICRLPDIKIESRGLICLFPEPYNPKATALLRSRGIVLENGVSRQLTEEDFDEKNNQWNQKLFQRRENSRIGLMPIMPMPAMSIR